MDKEKIKQQIMQCIQEGKSASQEASEYLRTHASEWNMEHEIHWRKLALKSRRLLGKAYKLKDMLDNKEELQ